MTNTISNVFKDIPIYWINLNDSIDRKNKMTQQLSDYNYNYRIEAVDGRDKEYFNKNYNIKYTTNVKFNTSLIAVICSHMKAIKTGYDSNYKMICVFEDDTNFDMIKYYPHTIEDIVNIAPLDWDIIQLYYTTTLAEKLNNYLIKGLAVYKRDLNYSGTCYLINRKGMEKILNNVVETNGTNIFNIKKPIIDPENIVFSSLNSYVVNLPFIYYYDDESTFDSYIENGVDFKNHCNRIQKNSKDYLIDFYQKNFKK
jgi:GR25 family glycosyltransferase involved in LPS biosynthesis